MRNTLISFLEKVDLGDFEGTSSLLDDILADNNTSLFSKMLEDLIETQDIFTQFQLKIRDHVMEYLQCQGLYFAFRLPSYHLLQTVSEQYERKAALNRMSEFVHLLISQNDPSLNLSFVDVDSLKLSSYVVLIPGLLSRREDEILGTNVYYSESMSRSKIRYSISDILQTHYGRKIAAACNINIQHPVVGDNDFRKLKHAMKNAFDRDIEDTMIEIPAEEWLDYVNAEECLLRGGNLESKEMQLLHTSAIARFQLVAANPAIAGQALLDISNSKTRFCNDAVVRIATIGAEPLRIEAVRLLEATKDMSQVDFLTTLIRGSSGGLRTAIATAVSSLSSSSFSSSVIRPTKKVENVSVVVEPPSNLMLVYKGIMGRLMESRSLQIRLDALKALVSFSIPGIDDDLKKVMLDQDPRIRLAVVELAEDLPRFQAHGIISIALEDEDSRIVKKATSILESRWPDDFW